MLGAADDEQVLDAAGDEQLAVAARSRDRPSCSHRASEPSRRPTNVCSVSSGRFQYRRDARGRDLNLARSRRPRTAGRGRDRRSDLECRPRGVHTRRARQSRGRLPATARDQQRRLGEAVARSKRRGVEAAARRPRRTRAMRVVADRLRAVVRGASWSRSRSSRARRATRSHGEVVREVRRRRFARPRYGEMARSQRTGRWRNAPGDIRYAGHPLKAGCSTPSMRPMSCVTGSHDTETPPAGVLAQVERGVEVVEQVPVASPSRPWAWRSSPRCTAGTRASRQTRRARARSCSTRSCIWSVSQPIRCASGATRLEAMPGCRRRQHAAGVASSAMARSRSCARIRTATVGHLDRHREDAGVETAEECGDELESRRVQQQRAVARRTRVCRCAAMARLPIELAPTHRERLLVAVVQEGVRAIERLNRRAMAQASQPASRRERLPATWRPSPSLGAARPRTWRATRSLLSTHVVDAPRARVDRRLDEHVDHAGPTSKPMPGSMSGGMQKYSGTMGAPRLVARWNAPLLNGPISPVVMRPPSGLRYTDSPVRRSVSVAARGRSGAARRAGPAAR